MGLTRKEQVAICQTCVKRRFDKNRGLLCSLTNEFAQFEKSCPDYEEDAEAVKRSDRLKSHETVTNGKKSAEAKALMIFGIVLIVAGVIMMFFYMSIGRFPFIALGPIIGGIGLCSRAGKMKPVNLDKPISAENKDKDKFEVY